MDAERRGASLDGPNLAIPKRCPWAASKLCSNRSWWAMQSQGTRCAELPRTFDDLGMAARCESYLSMDVPDDSEGSRLHGGVCKDPTGSAAHIRPWRGDLLSDCATPQPLRHLSGTRRAPCGGNGRQVPIYKENLPLREQFQSVRREVPTNTGAHIVATAGPGGITRDTCEPQIEILRDYAQKIRQEYPRSGLSQGGFGVSNSWWCCSCFAITAR